jgi:hypothetical protein
MLCALREAVGCAETISFPSRPTYTLLTCGEPSGSRVTRCARSPRSGHGGSHPRAPHQPSTAGRPAWATGHARATRAVCDRPEEEQCADRCRGRGTAEPARAPEPQGPAWVSEGRHATYAHAYGPSDSGFARPDEAPTNAQGQRSATSAARTSSSTRFSWTTARCSSNAMGRVGCHGVWAWPRSHGAVRPRPPRLRRTGGAATGEGVDDVMGDRSGAGAVDGSAAASPIEVVDPAPSRRGGDPARGGTRLDGIGGRSSAGWRQVVQVERSVQGRGERHLLLGQQAADLPAER